MAKKKKAKSSKAAKSKKKSTSATKKRATKKAPAKRTAKKKNKKAEATAGELEKKIQSMICDLLQQANAPVPLSVVQWSVGMLFPEPVVPQVVAKMVMRTYDGDGEFQVVATDGVDHLVLRPKPLNADRPTVKQKMREVLNDMLDHCMPLTELVQKIQELFGGNPKAAIHCMAIALNDDEFSTQLSSGLTKLNEQA